MDFVYDDGGRGAAGYKGSTGDCVVRAICIASGKPYQEVYDALNVLSKQRRGGHRLVKTAYGNKYVPTNSSRTGVARTVYEPYLLSLGFKWTPTMKIGSGCKVHLVKEELPSGTLIVRVSKHLTTVIDGVIHDTYNPQRGATTWYKAGATNSDNAVADHVSPDRYVYGYYSK